MLKLVKKELCHWIVYRREEAIKRLISMKKKGDAIFTSSKNTLSPFSKKNETEIRDPLFAERAYRYKKYLCSFTKDSSVWSFD